jgi:hypothetical protein
LERRALEIFSRSPPRNVSHFSHQCRAAETFNAKIPTMRPCRKNVDASRQKSLAAAGLAKRGGNHNVVWK